MLPRVITFFLLWLTVVAGLPGCQQSQEFVEPPPPPVTVAKPLQQAVTIYREFTGTTEAIEAVEIRARVTGFLGSIHFRPADDVVQGELLFVIEQEPYQAALDRAKATLESRIADHRLAKATARRKEAALKSRAISKLEVLQSQAEVLTAEAAIDEAKADVRNAEIEYSYTEIRAPISGRIGRNLVDEGNLVGAGEQTLLTTIVRFQPMYAYFNINERDLLRYGENRRDRGEDWVPVFELGLANEKGYPHKGRLDYIDNRVDETTGTITVRGVFPNATGRMVPGLFARIRIPDPTRQEALLVPENALGRDQRGTFLLVANSEDVVEYRLLQIGAQIDGGLRIVEDGLRPEDWVIVKGVQRARPGAKVAPEQKDLKQLMAAEKTTAAAKPNTETKPEVKTETESEPETKP
ncbi:MAG: efflux RND transporter periplasmic adaptor subunit [Desulfobacterales bacterium]|nr:efflux RND transporter periplasmic adaptor subunit [Desulfobacterales bacterium]MDJ0887333.1 efflux RND transporter periplasmic adaptor subunit [Desulfobacterales bacterium]MDJ0989922.1 efflux RND transporter periplasmic adaptor subunit [Desulfobacterales bacterium]